MKASVFSAWLLAVGLLPALAFAIDQRVCGEQIYNGCSPGGYNCIDDVGYQCSTIGTSQMKQGTPYPFQICVTKLDSICTESLKLCQRDTYWKDANCSVWCAEFSRYTSGC